MYLIKLLLQIFWQGSEIAALVLLRMWFIELDRDHGRVAHEILLNRSVTRTCFHALSPSTSSCKRYAYVYTHLGMESQLCLNTEKPYVQDTEEVKSFVPRTSSHSFTDSTS